MKEIMLILLVLLNAGRLLSNDSTRFQSYLTFQILNSQAIDVMPSNDDPLTQWKETKTMSNKIGYKFGVIYEFRLTSCLQVSTGLNLVNSGYKQDFRMGESIVYDRLDGVDYVYVNNAYKSFKRSEYFVAVPIKFRYTLIRNNLINFGIKAGFSWNYQIDHKTMTVFDINRDSNFQGISNVDVERVAHLLYLGANFSFKDGFFRPGIEPWVEYGINSREKLLGKSARDFRYRLSFTLPISLWKWIKYYMS